MQTRFLTLSLGLSLIAANLCLAAEKQTPNADVIRIAQAFPDGGAYKLTAGNSGVPEEINFNGQKILSKGDGTYCSGFTFAVAMKAATERGLLTNKTVAQIKKFQKEWYGATESSAEIQCSMAVTNLGIGKPVKFDDAQSGDFAQLWRGKSGHNVVFLGWLEEDGKKIGLRYRSSQTKTDGISDRTEYFGAIHGQKDPINPKRVYFCRLNSK